MRCRRCNGTGSLVARNGIDFPFSPGLASTMAVKCPNCEGFGQLDDEPCHGPEDTWCPCCGLGDKK